MTLNKHLSQWLTASESELELLRATGKLYYFAIMTNPKIVKVTGETYQYDMATDEVFITISKDQYSNQYYTASFDTIEKLYVFVKGLVVILNDNSSLIWNFHGTEPKPIDVNKEISE